MRPSPRALEMLEKLESIKARPLDELDPSEARNEDRRTTVPFLTTPEPVERIENLTVREGLSELPVRIYWPKITPEEDEEDLYPVIVYFHGGGWVLGALDMYDEVCSMLANKGESIVVSVDYRLAPEHKFPAAVHDCYSATKWAANNAKKLGGDEDTLVVAGDSAGGTLAVDVCLKSREKSRPQIAMQIPIYPVTDLSRDMSKYTKDRFGPSKESMDWFIRHYIEHDSDLRNPLASPQFADLGGLPPTILVAAEFDPLREQEIDFVHKLERSGVKVNLMDYLGAVHGFVTLPGYFQEGREAIEKIGSEIRRVYVENQE